MKKTTLPFRVTKHKSKTAKQKFTFKYRYLKNEKRKTISTVNLNKLKQKVTDKGLPWLEYEEMEEILNSKKS